MWETVALFPLPSVDVQVLVIVPPQLPPVNAPSLPATDPAPSQLSVQPRFVIAGISAIHSNDTSAGAAANTGAILSFTVIVCETVAVFPQASVYVQFLVIVPLQLPPVNAPSLPATDPAPSQLSVQPRFVISGPSSTHSTVTSEGAAANTSLGRAYS